MADAEILVSDESYSAIIAYQGAEEGSVIQPHREWQRKPGDARLTVVAYILGARDDAHSRLH